MSEGRQQADWNHTSHLLAMLANVNRAAGKAARHPREFHPFAGKAETEARPGPDEGVSIKDLKHGLIKGMGLRTITVSGRPREATDGG